mgnify:FL=1
MKSLSGIVFCLVLVGGIADAAPMTQDLYSQCSENFFVSSEIVTCLTEKLAESEKRLVDEQQRALMLLDKWDVDQEHKAEAKKNIIESNREFRKYKQENCNFSMSLMGGH